MLDFETATWKSGFTWCEAEGMCLPLESSCFPQGKCLLLSLSWLLLLIYRTCKDTIHTLMCIDCSTFWEVSSEISSKCLFFFLLSDPVLWSCKRLSRRPCSPRLSQEIDGTPLPTIRIHFSSIQFPEERKQRTRNRGAYDLCTQYMDWKYQLEAICLVGVWKVCYPQFNIRVFMKS